jgi:hypothetical protein
MLSSTIDASTIPGACCVFLLLVWRLSAAASLAVVLALLLPLRWQRPGQAALCGMLLPPGFW